MEIEIIDRHFNPDRITIEYYLDAELIIEDFPMDQFRKFLEDNNFLIWEIEEKQNGELNPIVHGGVEDFDRFMEFVLNDIHLKGFIKYALSLKSKN